jgi:hypothetical protein
MRSKTKPKGLRLDDEKNAPMRCITTKRYFPAAAGSAVFFQLNCVPLFFFSIKVFDF